MHTKNYKPSPKSLWTGRASDSQLGNQYWHQEIILCNFQNEPIPKQLDFAILGYACDAGVKRNLGRIGSSEGPDSIRQKLAKLPIHFENKHVADLGNIVCIDENMEEAQSEYSEIIAALIKNKTVPIGLGGGHDIAYASFKGIMAGLSDSEKVKIGVINFDAHFDLRPAGSNGNSGTPFFQILTEKHPEIVSVAYYAIGIQKQANTKELFEIAKKLDVGFIESQHCDTNDRDLNFVFSKLDSFMARVDKLYITIDMDGFSSAFAPGVSAPSALGFSPRFVYQVLAHIFASKKVVLIDIAETNPMYDQDTCTATLAARLVDFCVEKMVDFEF